jgi:hypothetical protein
MSYCGLQTAHTRFTRPSVLQYVSYVLADTAYAPRRRILSNSGMWQLGQSKGMDSDWYQLLPTDFCALWSGFSRCYRIHRQCIQNGVAL